MAYLLSSPPAPSRSFEDQAAKQMERVASIVLGGGQGTRLFPLTMTRCKPAIFFGGRYRLIDIPVSNALNSGCNKIFIVTQFLSSSLHRHILSTYQFNSFSTGFVQVLAAEQKPTKHVWFQGTADAVRQNLDYIVECPVDYFLILSGDQVYHLDFRHMIRTALETDADMVIATTPIAESSAKRMGVMQIDDAFFISNFIEKPQHSEILHPLRLTPKQKERIGSEKDFLGSMGIYLFKRKALIDLLNADSREDFGKHLIPTQIKKGRSSVYIHSDYWEDIGTISSFYEANISLTHPHSPFNANDEQHPIFTDRDNLPGPKIQNTRVSNSIFCEGCLISASEINNSILGPRTVVKENTKIENSYLMGCDFYEPPVSDLEQIPLDLTIGKNCVIQNAIIDRNVHIGDNVKLMNQNKLQQHNGDKVYIRDGIIVVTRGAAIPDHFTL